MNWLHDMNNALQYIEDNMTNDIKLEDIAKESYSSYFHFSRMFYMLSGINLGEYIRYRKLTLAANDLVTTNQKVIDIALHYGYTTPESFSKAFKKFHGVNPKDAKKSSTTLKFTPKLSFQINIKGDYIMDYEIKKLSDLYFTGYTINVTTKEGQNFIDIPAFWSKVMEDGTFKKLIPFSDEWGVMGIMYNWDMEKGTFTYMIGVHQKELPLEETESIQFEDDLFASFKVVGALPKAMQEVCTQIFSEWLPSSNYMHSGGPEIEMYTMGDGSKDDYVSYYMLPIKEK